MNVKKRLRINIREPMFGSKGGKPEEERYADMNTFHVGDPFVLDLFPKNMIKMLKPLVKKSIVC